MRCYKILDGFAMFAEPPEQTSTIASARSVWPYIHGAVQLRLCLVDLVESLANRIESVEGSCAIAKANSSEDILLAWLEIHSTGEVLPSNMFTSVLNS